MRALIYSVRPLAVLKYFGQLCTILALLTLVPLLVSVIFGDYGVSLRYGILAAVIFALGFYLRKLPSPKRLLTNEAMVLTALIFVFVAFVMTWPMMASGLSFLDALFESISAVTTTGLSVTASLADKTSTFLFARAWMQWVGGLGIVVLSLATMIQPGLAAKRIGDREDYEKDLVGSTRAHARRVLIVYASLTVLGILLLGLLGSGWLKSVLYTFAAVSTGGFAPDNSGLAGLANPWLQGMVILLSIAGAVPLALYYRSFKEGWKLLLHDRQIQGLIVAGLLTAVLLSWFLYSQDGFSWTQALRNGALNAFSAQSTAGFASLDISKLDAGSKLTLIFSMFLGGGAGSTAGGIKILRILILLRLIYLVIQRTAMPQQAVPAASLNGRKLIPDEIQNTLIIILLFIVIIAVSWLPFVSMGYNPLDSLFEVVSATGTVGLSSGISSPGLHPLLKGILCADMFLGRLEIIAFLILFYPRSWFGRRLEE